MVIDTLQHIRGNEFAKNIYAGDVEFDLTILALTHINKGKHDDDISKISGSEGMAGGTDGNWVLTKSKRTDTRANLPISNRDTEAFEFALEFDKESCRWNKLTRDESVVNEKEWFLHAIVDFIKAEETHHWEGTATELLTILQAREPILVSYSAAVFSKSLKAAQDSLREIYGVSYVSAFHNKKKWITLDYIEVK